ncbi:hypothetical protein KFZ56_16865 [Virgibacillus sp. NKC19-3]|uniref:hypothetical protein n=1 Tax=Virgibacillus saliphilus TaxID=2831674 RepID=UPI001C9B56B4|nr:hypothetical protein [Virgibacillus sp. NKC19-3]MBY7144693.1 hypothetical protein [Virgibacillus sp. NKC19-3]
MPKRESRTPNRETAMPNRESRTPKRETATPKRETLPFTSKLRHNQNKRGHRHPAALPL